MHIAQQIRKHKPLIASPCPPLNPCYTLILFFACICLLKCLVNYEQVPIRASKMKLPIYIFLVIRWGSLPANCDWLSGLWGTKKFMSADDHLTLPHAMALLNCIYTSLIQTTTITTSNSNICINIGHHNK